MALACPNLAVPVFGVRLLNRAAVRALGMPE